MSATSIPIMLRYSFTGLFFPLRIPSMMCSGKIDLLVSLCASSLLNARISDTFGDIWLLFAIYYPFYIFLNNCNNPTIYRTNIMPTRRDIVICAVANIKSGSFVFYLTDCHTPCCPCLFTVLLIRFLFGLQAKI